MRNKISGSPDGRADVRADPDRPGIVYVDVLEHGGAVYMPGDIVDTQLVPAVDDGRPVWGVAA